MAPRSGLERARGACVFALLALLMGLPAAAQESVAEGRILDVGLRARSIWAWPLGTSHGYLPIVVELTNDSSQPIDVSVIATGPTYRHYVECQAQEDLLLEGGESATVNLLVPNFTYGMNSGSANVEILAGGESTWLSQPSSGSHRSANKLGILAVHGSQPPAGTNEALTALASGMPPGATSGSSAYPSGHQESVVGATTWSHLPTKWQAYSSLDVVVLDAGDRAALDANLGPILAWVRLGGNLLLVGDVEKEVLARVDLLESVWESRYELADEEDSYAYGLGRIRHLQTPLDWGGATWIPAAKEFTLERHIFQGDFAAILPGRSLGPNYNYEEPFNTLPLRGFLAALLIFVVCIGPLNLIFLRRLRRPALLLLTVPGLSMVATLTLLGYGLFEQGLDVRVRDTTLAYVDQGRARVASVAMRDLFAGGFASTGLRPGPDTTVFPVGHHGRYGPSFRVERKEGSVVLAGDFMPSRRYVRQAVVSETATRLRIEVEAQGDGVVVRNGTSAVIRDLYYRTLDDRWFRVASLDPGAEQMGKPERYADSELYHDLFSAFQGAIHIPIGGFVASVGSDPFVDDLGIDAESMEGNSFMIGELAEDEAL